MKKIDLVPNSITVFGLACGLFVIFKINMVEPGMGNYDVVRVSALLLLVAAVADFMDGALARAIHAESEFGFILDSLADAISFGVAPAVLMLKTLSLQQGTLVSFLGVAASMVFALCGVLRLARFTVRARLAKNDPSLQKEQSKYFTGLPIPASAAAAVSVNLFFLTPVAEKWISFDDPIRPLILISAMFLLGYLMVSRLKFPSLKNVRLSLSAFPLALVLVAVAVGILYGILYYFSQVFVLLSWSYIAVSLILSMIRMIAGKKSKTLEEFEPEPEDQDFI